MYIYVADIFDLCIPLMSEMNKRTLKRKLENSEIKLSQTDVVRIYVINRCMISLREQVRKFWIVSRSASFDTGKE